MLDPSGYHCIIRKLLYLIIIHPDVSFAMQQLSQYAAYPRNTYYQAATHVLKYLKGAFNRRLFYSSSSMLHGFFYADWRVSLLDHKSLFGYCMLPGSSLISLKAKK